MDRYLTATAKKRRLWDIPVAAISGGLGLLALSVGTEDLRAGIVPGEDLWANVVAAVLVVWMMLIPLIRIVRRRVRQRLARKISAALARRDEDALPLEELDAVTGIRGAAGRVKTLLSKGFLQKLAIDEDEGMLLLDNPPAEAPQPEPRPADDAEAVLARIRRLNDEIEAPAVSAHIDRIEALTASIYATVRQRPERAETARKFVNYYLPTTLKLLRSYSLMEDQSYQGENITASRRQIEQILGKLVYAVEQQQDKLFQTEALDVESDIRVLETMMAADGLAQREGGR